MGLFASTGLPIIVAVTAVAVDAGEMTADQRVGPGRREAPLTVLICPFLAQRAADAPRSPGSGESGEAGRSLVAIVGPSPVRRI